MPQGTGEWHIDVELLIEFYTCLSNVCTSQSIFRCRKMIGQRYHYEPTILSHCQRKLVPFYERVNSI